MSRRYVYLLITAFFTLAYAAPFDTYPKNKKIDIVHYAFQLTLTDANDIINGITTIDVFFRESGVDQLRFDLINKSDAHNGKGMSVSKVTMNGKPLDFSHKNDALMVDLPETSKANQQIQIKIEYAGIPASGLKIAPNKYGDRSFFSDNWPNRARNWLPTVDHPYDKATSEMIITAPNHYQVISNGLLIEETNIDKNTMKTHWKQSVPISTWLYCLGVAEFAVQYYDTFEGKSLQTWVYKQDRDKGFYDFAVPSKHALEFYSDYVGPFAYEKLANIQSNSVGGGMEAATAIFYGDKSVTGERSTRWRNVIIHEVAHQWFGNAVTEYDWDDIWLSEGVTTFFTLLFREHAYGHDDYVFGLKNAQKRIYNFYKKNKDYRIVHDNLDDMSKVTTGQIYQKGAWIVHMLRNLVGEDAFKQGFRSYYTKYFNGNATTAQLKHEMEVASGMNLDQFFQQWLYQGGHIILDGNWSANGKSLTIDLKQVQNDGYEFKVPVEFAVYVEGKELPEYHSVQMNKMDQTFSINASENIMDVKPDPKTKLLAEWTFKKN